MRSIFLTLISIFTFLPISAQKLSVESFVQTTDAIARTRNVMGTDGNVCAAVVVRIPSKEATFSGGFIIGQPTYKDGEYILDMQTGAAQMRVSVPGFNTIDVKFREYLDGAALQSKTTYLLTINVPQPGVADQQKKQMLNIKVTPSDAMVLIDDEMVEGTSVRLTVGSHKYNVAARGYESQSGMVDVPENRPGKLTVELDRKENAVQSNNTVATPTVNTSTSVTQPSVAVSTSSTAHEYVDLGLSVKWATCNIGASSPEEYGDYYAWGETETKSSYSWSTYKWCKGSSSTMTKYCTKSSYGTVDNKTQLDPADDVAHVKWGGSWRMPTKAEQDELRENCTWTWTTLDGKYGYKVTSKKNGNSIFLPAAGGRGSSDLDSSRGFYWSSSLYPYYDNNAYYLIFYSGNWNWGNNYRYVGHSVRAVCP